MTLTLTFNCACRLCGAEFDPTATAEAITPGGHRFTEGRIRIPRVARRHLLPFVCDECWEGFSRWMAAKELAQHREDAKKHGKNVRQHWTDSDARKTSNKYESFSKEVLFEWLADGLKTKATIELRDRVVGIATKAAEKRAERARNYWGQKDPEGKASRRNWSRFAPDYTPDWARWQER